MYMYNTQHRLLLYSLKHRILSNKRSYPYKRPPIWKILWVASMCIYNVNAPLLFQRFGLARFHCSTNSWLAHLQTSALSRNTLRWAILYMHVHTCSNTRDFVCYRTHAWFSFGETPSPTTNTHAIHGQFTPNYFAGLRLSLQSMTACSLVPSRTREKYVWENLCTILGLIT